MVACECQANPHHAAKEQLSCRRVERTQVEGKPRPQKGACAELHSMWRSGLGGGLCQEPWSVSGREGTSGSRAQPLGGAELPGAPPWGGPPGWGGVAEALWENPTGAEQGVGSNPAVGRARWLLHTCGASSFRTSLMFF